MSGTDPAFTVFPDPLPTYILLAISCAALILSVLPIFVERTDNRRQHQHRPPISNNASSSTFVHSGDAARRSNKPESSPTPDQENDACPPKRNTSTNDAKNPQDSQHSQHNNNDEEDARPRSRRPPGAIRALLLTLFARLFFCAVLLGSMALGIYLLVPTLNTNALHMLADDRTNRWLHKLMQRAVLQYAANADRPDLAASTTRVGVGEHLIEPDAVYHPLKWRWIMFIVVFVFFIVVGVALRLTKGLFPSKRSVTFITLAQLIFWFCLSLIIAFAFPRDFPFQGQPLRNYWLDRNYSVSLNNMNETRLISNFYVSTISSSGEKTVTNLNDLPDFVDSFCTQYFQLTPTTEDNYPSSDPLASIEPSVEPTAEPTTEPSSEEEYQEQISDGISSSDPTDEPTGSAQVTTIIISRSLENINPKTMQPAWSRQDFADPESIPVSELPAKLYNEVFSVYLIGKPMGTDFFRAIAYMGLPFLVATPILATYMLRSFILYPFFALWIGTLCILAVFGTPSILRIITAPVDQKGIVSFCRLNYRVQVLDHTTRVIARMDLAIFVITGLVVFLQSLRWLKESDFVAKQKWPEPKRVRFEQVYRKWTPSQR